MKQTKRIENEIKHFSDLEHIWWGAKTPAGQRRYDNKLKMLKALCRIKKGSKILEIGAGDGEFTRRLSKLDATIYASDITPKVVAKGKRTIKNKNVKFMVDNAEKMRFKSSSFDIICGISILHHLDPKKALKEAFRVLKPGGQLFFTEPNLINPHIYLGLHISWMRKRMEFSPDEKALIRWQVANMLTRIGFREVNVRNYDFLHPKTPVSIMNMVERISDILERIPVLKEISGSMIVWAKK